MYDIAIIGGGPAGLSAAITAGTRNAACLVIAPEHPGGWLHKAPAILNYPGLPGISGAELLQRFKAQAASLGADFRSALVTQILRHHGVYKMLAGDDILEARAVILAIGANTAKPLDGEEELIGDGVSYCATCDGMFYRGKSVAILSSTEQGVHEANYLSALAGQASYYTLKAHDIGALEGCIAVRPEKPVRLHKQNGRVAVNDTAYDGVFIIRPTVAPARLLPDLHLDGAFIQTNRLMETNLPGTFAAGDCTGTPLQIAKAAGEGNIAALTACTYLEPKRREAKDAKSSQQGA